MIMSFGIIEQINYKNMKKEDLIIDKLYIHSNDRKAYYRGEDDNYGSIFELVDDVGCSNLTSSFPHLKSIASNTYWGYSSLHEEFNEIENLNLMKIQISDKELLEKAKRDYPIGTEYYPAHLTPNEDCKCIMNEDSFNKLYISGNSIVTGKNNKEGWSEVVYHNDTWATIISKPETKIDIIPEYVECIKQSAGFTKGKIYQITNTFEIIDDDNEVRNVKGYWEQEFSFSIKEAYELQNKPKYEVVHCKTQEEWDFARVNIQDNVALSSNFDKDRVNCLQLNPISGSYSRLKFYQDHNSKIYTFQEWCDLNGYKMEKEVKFEVGKWYKNLSKNSQKNTFGKFLNLRNNDKEFWMSECIYKGKFTNTQGWLNYSSETVEINIEEIQQYLPEGHPDKIVDKSIKQYTTGSYVVALNNKLISHSIAKVTKGNIYYLNSDCRIKDDANLEIIFRRIDETNLKWFPTLQEAEEFAKTLKKEEMKTTIKELSFYVKYCPEFTEDLYNKLWEWSKINSKGSPRGFSDSYNGLTKWGMFYFDINCIGGDYSYGVDNNKQRCKEEYSIQQVKDLIGYKEEEYEYDVNDWVLLSNDASGWGAPSNVCNQIVKIVKITKISSDSQHKYRIWFMYNGEEYTTIPKEIVRKVDVPKANISPIPEKWGIRLNNNWDILSEFKPFKIAEETNGLNLSLKKDTEESKIKIYNTNIKTLDLSLKNN